MPSEAWDVFSIIALVTMKWYHVTASILGVNRAGTARLALPLRTFPLRLLISAVQAHAATWDYNGFTFRMSNLVSSTLRRLHRCHDQLAAS